MLAEKKIIVRNKLGLHARPAAMFVQIANKYESEIIVRKGNSEVNGKSIMGILTLAAGKGASIYIKIEGPDAEKAMEELELLLAGTLDEGKQNKVI